MERYIRKREENKMTYVIQDEDPNAQDKVNEKLIFFKKQLETDSKRQKSIYKVHKLDKESTKNLKL